MHKYFFQQYCTTCLIPVSRTDSKCRICGGKRFLPYEELSPENQNYLFKHTKIDWLYLFLPIICSSILVALAHFGLMAIPSVTQLDLFYGELDSFIFFYVIIVSVANIAFIPYTTKLKRKGYLSKAKGLIYGAFFCLTIAYIAVFHCDEIYDIFSFLKFRIASL